MLFWGVNDFVWIDTHCAPPPPGYVNIACTDKDTIKWDSGLQRWEVTRAVSAFHNPSFSGWGWAALRHAYAHEIGHMFGLAHPRRNVCKRKRDGILGHKLYSPCKFK
jgi:hypothetical protein